MPDHPVNDAIRLTDGAFYGADPHPHHPLGDEHAITREGNMATLPRAEALGLCRRVPRAIVENSVYWGTAEDVAPKLVAEIEAGARHLALCNYVGFLSRAEASAGTAELIKLAKMLRARFAGLAAEPLTMA